jgi:MFS family permease
MTALRSALPLLAVTLVNKVASLAMSLLPAILVAREVSAGDAAAVMIVGKGAAVFGTLFSGSAADRYGARRVLVASLVVAGLGAYGMAVAPTSAALAAAAATAQIGLACFPVLNRVIIAGSVALTDQREALAWLRSTANLGLIVSFALGGVFGAHVAGLVLLDGTLALAAAALGAALLPDVRPAPVGRAAGEASTLGPFLAMTAMMCAWSFAYDGFLTACAAQLRASLGPSGVSVFSWVMVLNTVGCALLGVVAANRIASPDRTVVPGFALLAVGSGLAVTGSPAAAFVGMALATAGELVFSATGQFVWMALTPNTHRRSSVFSVAMTANFLARAAGAAVVFPLVVDGAHPALAMGALALPGLVLAALGAPVWAAFRGVGGIR